MRDRKKYMYINFQQNRVCRSVKTVRTNLFAQYDKLHKLATTNSNFKNLIILDMYHHKTYMYRSQPKYQYYSSSICSLL